MRRLPLHALRACTCAVLLVGCQSAVAPTPPPPPPAPWLPSLSVEVSGPFRIDAIGSFSWDVFAFGGDRKSTRLNSSHGYISYAVFCLKKKKKQDKTDTV